MHIVTLGAVIRLPDQFANVTQFIGENDWFGLINSRPNLSPHRVPGAWHSLNTTLPGHMAVGEVLMLAGVQ